MAEVKTKAAADRPKYRPWWKWHVFTLLALMLSFIGVGHALNGRTGMFIAVWVAIAFWVVLPLFAFPGRWFARGFCWMFGRHSRMAAWSMAVAAICMMIVTFPYLRHFAATELVWRLGGQIQYEGGKYIGNVFASQVTFREISGETWRKRFFGPVLTVKLNPFDAPVPIWFLQSFSELEYLASVSMGADDMQYLRDFPMLENLVIAAKGNLDAGLPHLKELPNLTGLRFNGVAAISDEGLRTIAQLPKLEGLWIASQAISDEGLKHLANSSVTNLILDSHRITDQGLLNLQGMKLKSLSLESKFVTNEGILAVRRAIPGLETYPEPQPTNAAELALIAQLEGLGLGFFQWKLDDVGRIGDLVMQSYDEVTAEGTMPNNRSSDHHLTHDEAAIFEQLPNLARVSIRSRDITDGGLAQLKNSSKLKELRVVLCPINGEGLIHLPRPSRLEVLDLSECPIATENFRHLEGLDALTTLILVKTPIADEGLARLPDLPNLQFVLVQECQISDRGVAELSRFPGLIYLNLFGNDAITDESVSTIVKLESLEELNLHATGVTKAGVERLLAALPDCQIYVDEAADPYATGFRGERSESEVQAKDGGR